MRTTVGFVDTALAIVAPRVAFEALHPLIGLLPTPRRDPSVGLELRLSIEAAGELEAVPPESEPIFFHGSVVVRRRGVGYWVTDGFATVEIEGVSARARVSRLEEPGSGIFFRTTLVIVLSLLARELGWFHVHSACVVPPGWRSALLLPGTGGSGKSTAAVSMGLGGGSFLADDVVFVRLEPDGGALRAWPWNKPVHLHPSAFAQLFSEGSQPVARTFRDGTEKLEFDPPPSLCGEASTRGLEVGGVAFPEVGFERRSRSVPLSQAETLGALLEASALSIVDGLTQQRRHLACLAGLASRVPAYSWSLGNDVLRHPSDFMGWVLRTLQTSAGPP